MGKQVCVARACYFFQISLYFFVTFRIKALRSIHVTNTTGSFEGWIRVNFTEMLDNWVKKTRPNNLLYITIAYENGDGVLETSSVDTNYLLSFWDDEHQPFVTAYFTNENHDVRFLPSTSNRHRSKRSAGKRPSRRRHHRVTSVLTNPLINRNQHANPRNCQRYTLYISFKDLQWKDWIIAPEG